MLWNTVAALMDVAAGRVHLMDNIFGLTLLPVFGALFAWPGLLFWVTKSWAADGLERRLQIITTLGFKSWIKQTPVENFKAVRAYRGTAGSRSANDTEHEMDQKRAAQPYCVELMAAAHGKPPQIMGAFQKAAASRELGAALAGLFRLPLVDDTMRENDATEE